MIYCGEKWGPIMRLLSLVLFFFLTSEAYAQACEVYGISDSPQTLDCAFKRFGVKLRCKSGTYYLNESKVETAFHMEVEEGPVPLVFKANDMQLTILIQSKIDIEAELEQKGKTFMGSCQ